MNSVDICLMYNKNLTLVGNKKENRIAQEEFRAQFQKDRQEACYFAIFMITMLNIQSLIKPKIIDTELLNDTYRSNHQIERKIDNSSDEISEIRLARNSTIKVKYGLPKVNRGSRGAALLPPLSSRRTGSLARSLTAGKAIKSIDGNDNFFRAPDFGFNRNKNDRLPGRITLKSSSKNVDSSKNKTGSKPTQYKVSKELPSKLSKISQRVRKDPEVAKSLDKLQMQLKNIEFHAGRGALKLPGTDTVYYMRSGTKARLFFKYSDIERGRVGIIGESNKDKEQ